MKGKSIPCLGLGLFFWLTAACVWGAPSAAPPVPAAEPAGTLTWQHNQLQFSLPALDSGYLSSDAFVGAITLCYFWAEWDRASRDQVQWLNDFWKQNKSFGVQFIGFCVDAEPGEMKRVFKQEHWQFPCCLIPSQRLIASQGPVKGLPTLVVLSPGGVVVHKYEGLFSLGSLENDIVGLLSQNHE
jgi:hypothetical protein